MTDRLIREGDPPSGQLACPVPQYEKVDGTKERVRGQDGGVYSVILGADGNPISSGNPWPVQLNGSKLQEQLTEADAVGGVLTFSESINTIEIYNTDSANAGVFTVNGIAITMPAGATFKADVGGIPSATVIVSGDTTSYIVGRYE